MEANKLNGGERRLFVKGVDVIIRRDLAKHKSILERERINLLAYQEAVSHAIEQKRYYWKLIGGEKYDDDALRKSVEQQKVNIRHLQDKVKLTKESIEHHTMIVDTLGQQLKDYEEANAAADRCV